MPGMNPHMMPNGMPGMIPGMMPGMMPGMGGMMPGMLQPPYTCRSPLRFTRIHALDRVYMAVS